MFLIFKESINNIAKHSRCANARAEFRADNLRMFLLVKRLMVVVLIRPVSMTGMGWSAA